jgi:hypothetical protein
VVEELLQTEECEALGRDLTQCPVESGRARLPRRYKSYGLRMADGVIEAEALERLQVIPNTDGGEPVHLPSGASSLADRHRLAKTAMEKAHVKQMHERLQIWESTGLRGVKFLDLGL